MVLSHTAMAEDKGTPYLTCEHIKQDFADYYGRTDLVECILKESGVTGIKKFYPSGSLETEYQIKNGKREGNYVSYYDVLPGDTAQVKTEVAFENGKQEGKQSNYWQNGKLQLVLPYKGGQIHGTSTYTARDGSKSYSRYKNGWLDGRQKSPAGSIYDTCYSDGDQLVMSVFGCRKTSRLIKSRLELAQESCEGQYKICGNLERLTGSRTSAEIAMPKATDKPINKPIKDTLAPYKAECEEIGYQKGTEKFGECVLKLLDRS